MSYNIVFICYYCLCDILCKANSGRPMMTTEYLWRIDTTLTTLFDGISYFKVFQVVWSVDDGLSL